MGLRANIEDPRQRLAVHASDHLEETLGVVFMMVPAAAEHSSSSPVVTNPIIQPAVFLSRYVWLSEPHISSLPHIEWLLNPPRCLLHVHALYVKDGSILRHGVKAVRIIARSYRVYPHATLTVCC